MTDPYIPTTDEMRVRASTFWIDDKTYEVDKQRAHEFDRWLSDVKSAVWDEAIHEAGACGWLPDLVHEEMLMRNPYRGENK
jgi:hypothetical protein